MGLPKINFFIGATALCFQALILYPCHETISHQMLQLERNIQKLHRMEKELEKHIANQKQKNRQ